MVKLETTKDRRRLHIGSFFADLNETDYQELIRIFTNENVVKNISSNPVLADSAECTCDTCGRKATISKYCRICDRDE